MKCIASQIPVVDGYRNLRRIFGTLGFRDFEAAVLEDRRRRFATGEGGTGRTHTDTGERAARRGRSRRRTTTFRELKAREAPAYQNLSTIESAELLMSYSVDPFLPRHR